MKILQLIDGHRVAVARLLAAGGLLAALSAHADGIYRWVDENGRTHVSGGAREVTEVGQAHRHESFGAATR